MFRPFLMRFLMQRQEMPIYKLKKRILKGHFLIQKTMGIVATFPEHNKKLSRKSHILHYLMQEENTSIHQKSTYIFLILIKN